VVTRLLRMAVTLTRGLEGGLGIDEALDGVQAEDWQAMPLTPESCGHLKQKIDTEFESVVQMLQTESIAA